MHKAGICGLCLPLDKTLQFYVVRRPHVSLNNLKKNFIYTSVLIINIYDNLKVRGLSYFISFELTNNH